MNRPGPVPQNRMTTNKRLVKRPSITPESLMDGARMFAAAADAVAAVYPNAFHVLSHMLGMSLELSLKAFLMKADYSERRLKTLGHDLGSLFDEAVREGLNYTGSRNFVLRVTGAVYSSRVFAYPAPASMHSIEPWRLREMARELIETSYRSVYGKDALERHKAEPGIAIRSSYTANCMPDSWATDFQILGNSGPRTRWG